MSVLFLFCSSPARTRESSRACAGDVTNRSERCCTVRGCSRCPAAVHYASCGPEEEGRYLKAQTRPDGANRRGLHQPLLLCVVCATAKQRFECPPGAGLRPALTTPGDRRCGLILRRRTCAGPAPLAAFWRRRERDDGMETAARPRQGATRHTGWNQ
jgi:hypothetical protein